MQEKLEKTFFFLNQKNQNKYYLILVKKIGENEIHRFISLGMQKYLIKQKPNRLTFVNFNIFQSFFESNLPAIARTFIENVVLRFVHC